MKKLFYVISMILLVFQGFIASAQNKNTDTKILVYYFHATQRCPTCLAIEENTRKALQNYFGEELKKGSIVLQTINVDKPENAKLAEKYEASGSALWITKNSGGKETKKDLTNFAFSYGRSNPEKFMDGLKNEISNLGK